MNEQSPRSTALPACYHGCGDYPEWIAYEAAAAQREERAERMARFTENLDLPPDLYEIRDGRVLSARTGQPLEPLRDQIERMKAEFARHEYLERKRTDAVTLKPLLDLFSNLKG